MGGKHSAVTACHCEPFASCHSERSEESRDPSLSLRVTIKQSVRSLLCQVIWTNIGYSLSPFYW